MKKLLKAVNCEIKEIDEEERSFLAVASTEDVDRDGDRIMASGWDLENFRANPVIPWAHRYGDPPVAKAVSIGVEDGSLMFKPKFPAEGEYPFADVIWKLYKGGYLSAFSVGFQPRRREIVERDKGIRGYDFMEQELWEISACTVPSNPHALVAAKSAGIISEQDEALFAEAQSSKLKAQSEEKSELEARFDNLESKLDALLALVSTERIARALDLKPEPEADASISNFKSEISNSSTPSLDATLAGETLTETQLAEIVASVTTGILEKLKRIVVDTVDYHKGIVR